MKAIACLCLALVLCGASTFAAAQDPEPGTISVTDLISAVATKTGKKFIVEPRVRAPVMLLGQSPSSVSLPELATILQPYGFVVIEYGNYVRVLPDAAARTQAVPLAAGNERHGDAEVVSRVIKVKSIPATFLVPILRPLVPQYGHLVAVPCTNVLMLVDSYANVRRLEAIVQSLDTAEKPFEPPSCSPPQGEATEKR
jgi:type II secretory pathway component GspD/PulD (secretin)